MYRFRHVVLAAVFAALALSAYEGWALGRTSGVLRTEAAPRKMISLQVAPTAVEANRILASWGCPNGSRCEAARESLVRDTRYILSYVAFGLLLVWWGTLASRVPWWAGAALGVMILAAGVCDFAENWLLGLSLGNAAELPFDPWARWVPGFSRLVAGDTPLHAHAFAFARLMAMSKFALLLMGLAGAFILAGGASRVWLVRRRAETRAPAEKIEFSKLVQDETDGIFAGCPNRPKDQPKCGDHVAADEQFVTFREADVIGLALSGGGIRSATFNLGLLQGLHRARLLGLVDYLSTVSGGGYVGAFWSAWLRRGGEIFPPAQNSVDSEQERHLREFSGFLAPRWGFFEVESWIAVVAVLAGLLPALAISLAVIGSAWIVWLALTFPLASHLVYGSMLVIAVVTLVALILFELFWQRLKQESAGEGSGTRGWFAGFAALAMVLAAGLQFCAPLLYDAYWAGAWPVSAYPPVWFQAPEESGMVRWYAVTAISKAATAWAISPRLFDYGLVWLAAGLILLLVRFTDSIASWNGKVLAAFDRVLMRILGLGVIWCCVAVLWHVAVNLGNLAGVAVSAILSAGVFAALRNWMGVALQRPRETGMLDRLKPLLPQVLAYVTLALAAVLVGRGIIDVAGTDWIRWWLLSAAVAATMITALFVKPENFGLHRFYRERIRRAYIGACNLAEGKGAADNRTTEPRLDDDISLQDLVARPLHLICCAANDLSGDQVETLNRGARSAVLSRLGMSLGKHARELNPNQAGNWLGSAVTASAAAFNSNMGQLSARVGPVVSFLMTALNLRLGLWVRHPKADDAGPRRWPGLLYYREMFGLTSSSGRLVDGKPGPFLRDVHLSDGGHFENLALYELIRRRCRYVIVSDCGADPTLAFSDLGNAIRRIREDFGVDIELDVSPLRPGEKSLSRQHVVAGTIHYSPTDKGILLYFKPTITGDEPTDVMQYRNRNSAFPHESTVDQFYDEAQWESYRRLGLHAAQKAFEFVERTDRHNADFVFAGASRQWGPTPDGLEERVLQMTERFGALESELRHMQSRGMLRDVFPEMEFAQKPAKAEEKAPAPAPAEDGAPELTFVLRVTQLMEDVWLSCDLDKWWAHPLNMGWINLFARWATSPPFRFWWPLVSPMFSVGFREFVAHRFPTRQVPMGNEIADPQAGLVQVLEDIQASNGLAAVWWRERSTQPIRWNTTLSGNLRRQFYENLLNLPEGPENVRKIQAGLAAVIWSGKNVAWTSDDFFVPPSLWGAGIGSRFLDNLLVELSKQSAETCYVVVKAPPAGSRHQVALDDRRSFSDQYRRLGFRSVQAFPEHSDLPRALSYEKGEDALLQLNLADWMAHNHPQDPPRSQGASA